VQVSAITQPPASTADRSHRSDAVVLGADPWYRSDAIVMLQVFAVAVMVFPSDTVFRPIGAAGYPASLVGVVIFAAFVASVLFGFYHPGRHPHPIRGVLALIWIAVLASYIAMDRDRLTGIELASADRILIRFAVVTGVALVAAEWLTSLEDAMRVVRALCWGAAICGIVAILQFWMSLDLSQYLRELPGFTANHDNPAIQLRGTLNRVQGTAITPIELGVVMGMLIPIAVCLGLYDRDKSRYKRWAPLTLIILGSATSVSRSAILALVVSFATLLVLLPPLPRLSALAVLPIAVAGIFVSAHGLIGTLASFFEGASHDPSIQYRTHDYPLAEQMWQSAPWFGQGPGTWIPAKPLDIFDNQYLNSVVELGLVGVLALFVFLTVPAVVALATRRMSRNPDLRLLCAALASAGLVAPVASFTFDSLSFPMFVNVYALVIGLVGVCSRLALAECGLARAFSPAAVLSTVRVPLPRPAAFRPRRAEP
jgi:O-antigen ligase